MDEFKTKRLLITPTHPQVWAIYDQWDQQLIGKMFFKSGWFNILLKPQSLKLGVASEASHGLLSHLKEHQFKAKTDQPHAQQFLLDLGFTPHGDHFVAKSTEITQPDPYQTLNQDLGIAPNELKQPFHPTCCQLVNAEKDCFDRPTLMHPSVLMAWNDMKHHAAKEGIALELVSAFRSIRYQAGLIQKKLDQGQTLSEILKVNAAPGHSEHHTGCAIDINTPGEPPLEESFESTDAFAWLTTNAQAHGFHMSYPRNNQHGIIYEPWHWRLQ